MEKNNLDLELQKIINETDNFYNKAARESKGKIWMEVRGNWSQNHFLNIIRVLTAACIILLLSTLFLTISNFKANKKIDALLMNEINSPDHIYQNEEISLAQNEEIKVPIISDITDSVYIDKSTEVRIPVIVEKLVYDTLYIERQVFIERKIDQNALVATIIETNENVEDHDLNNPFEFGRTILTQESVKPEKEKEIFLKFRIGGNRQPIKDRSLAFAINL